jgi:hypothetical protein
MRRGLALCGLCAGLAACAAPMRWEKAGADDKATGSDMASCRNAAREEAFRYYFPVSTPFFGPRYWFNRADTNRYVAEINLTRFCMQNKGYTLVPVEKNDGDR